MLLFWVWVYFSFDIRAQKCRLVGRLKLNHFFKFWAQAFYQKKKLYFNIICFKIKFLLYFSSFFFLAFYFTLTFSGETKFSYCRNNCNKKTWIKQNYLFYFSVPENSVSTVQGSSVELPCNVTAPAEGDSVRLVLWFKNESSLPIYT